jgi:hypothetical protein
MDGFVFGYWVARVNLGEQSPKLSGFLYGIIFSMQHNQFFVDYM